MVCVPPFASTGQAAMLDLETLECTPLKFSSAVGGVNGATGDASAAAPVDADVSAEMEVEAAAAD